eukprot:2067686-Rhodomonas_salina.2
MGVSFRRSLHFDLVFVADRAAYSLIWCSLLTETSAVLCGEGRLQRKVPQIRSCQSDESAVIYLPHG